MECERCKRRDKAMKQWRTDHSDYELKPARKVYKAWWARQSRAKKKAARLTAWVKNSLK